jgi:methyl-accepting chemotaxis protein
MMKWTFAKKIVATLALLGSAYALSAGATWWALEKMAAQTKSTITQDMAQLEQIGQMRYLMLQIRRAEKDITIDLGLRPEGIKKRTDRWNELAAQLAAQADLVMALEGIDKYKALELSRSGVTSYINASTKVVQQVASGQLTVMADFEKALDAPKKAIREAEEASSKVIAQVAAAANNEYQEIGAALIQVRWVLTAGSFTILVLSIMLGYLLIRSLRRPINALAGVMHSVGQGDLSTRADTTRGDELSVMAGNFNEMVDHLRQTLSKVQLASQSIATTSDAVASGNRDLSERTE